MTTGYAPYTYPQGDLYVPVHVAKALEARRDEERRERRRESWGRIWSLTSRIYSMSPGGGREKPMGTASYAYLRLMRDRNVIDRAIINTRRTQVLRVAHRVLGPGQTGFRVRHARADDPDFEVTDRIAERCREMEELLCRVTKPFHTSVRDVLAASIEEELVLDRKCMVVRKDRRGRPYSYHLIDGATVFPRIHVIFREVARRGWGWEDMNMDRLAQTLSYESKVDITDAEYVQVVDGRVVGAWKGGELSVDTTQASAQMDRWGYGQGSILEQSLELSRAFTTAFVYNSELLNTAIPEAIMAVFGDYDDKALEEFKARLASDVGAGGWWRLPVIPGGDVGQFDIKMFPLRQPQKEMQFLEWLIMLVAIKCAFYRMHPGLINIHPRAGSAPLIEHDKSAEELIVLSQEEGFRQLLENVADWWTRTLIVPHYDDLVVVWMGLDHESPMQIEQRRQMQMRYNTYDELRSEAGKPALPDEIPERVGDVVPDAYYMQALQFIQQMKQQKEAEAEGGMPGMMGGPPGMGFPGGGPGGPPGAGGPPGMEEGGNGGGMPGGGAPPRPGMPPGLQRFMRRPALPSPQEKAGEGNLRKGQETLRLEV